jgi:hypothetical protein
MKALDITKLIQFMSKVGTVLKQIHEALLKAIELQ